MIDVNCEATTSLRLPLWYLPSTPNSSMNSKSHVSLLEGILGLKVGTSKTSGSIFVSSLPYEVAYCFQWVSSARTQLATKVTLSCSEEAYFTIFVLDHFCF